MPFTALEQQGPFNKKTNSHVHRQIQPRSFEVVLYRTYKEWFFTRVIVPATLYWYTNYNFSGLSSRAVKHPLNLFTLPDI